MQTLTRRQQEVLDLIRGWLEEHGAPPTRAEISQALGFRSATAAEDHLRALARKGYLELRQGRNRNIRLLRPEPEVRSSTLLNAQATQALPLVGQVAAGSPILAVENIEGYYGSAALFQPRADYLLRVKGDSMMDAGIEDGDLLAVRKTPEARSGDIVIARLDDEVTVKTLQHDQNRLRLLPANPACQPIEVDPERQTLAIEGVAVGVIRPRIKRPRHGA
ncbi:MAG: transcriptional repressor LexA [Candidatus Competibacteraceae bacterium]|nr:transcriptional repressor LexA [Candidatus Competibacteraceae bacterium]